MKDRKLTHKMLGCYSMAVSAQLGNANLKPEYLNTTATVTMKKEEPHGWTVTGILMLHLSGGDPETVANA
jgi:osmotically inducible protein OsmC